MIAIYVLYDPVAETHTLMCSSRGMGPTVAGPRLFRGQPWPDVQWVHLDSESAEKDAATLRAYLAECAGRKKASKAKERGMWV